MCNYAKADKVLNDNFSHCDHWHYSSGDRTVTMFSKIINDLVKDVEGASLSEKLLGAPAHKFYVTPKDTCTSVIGV